MDLLKMSHMYDVECLLKKCTEKFIKDIDDDNTVYLWSVAESLSIDKLKEAVLEYLGQKGEKMLEVPGFKETFKSPEMMTSLVTYMAKLTDQLKATPAPARPSASPTHNIFRYPPWPSTSSESESSSGHITN